MMKERINDLALFSGRPMFAEKVYVGRPNIVNRELFVNNINDMLDRRWLTNNGPYVQELEKKIVEYTGVQHCVAVCNGTIGLLIACQALEMTGEVILPSFTFVATAHVLQWQGIEPIFCDIDPQTLNLDPQQVEQQISPSTTGIIGVHVYGRPADVETLERISSYHGIKLLFDAAHAFGCSCGGRMVGNFGHAEVFSFHATKFFHTFEGGAILTNDKKLADRMRLQRNFGFSGYDNVIDLGINGKMSEASAAMGLAQMAGLSDLVAVNQSHYEQYQSILADTPGLDLLKFNGSEKNNYQYVVLRVDEDKAGVTRDQLVELLHAENVLARRYFSPGCHRMEPYRTRRPDMSRTLPNTEMVSQQVVCLPTGNAIGSEEVKKICSLIQFIVANNVEIQLRLSGQ